MKEIFIKRNYKKSQNIEEEFFYNGEYGSEINVQEGDDKFLGKHLSERRINILLVFVMFGLLIIFARVFQLQIVRGEYYNQLA